MKILVTGGAGFIGSHLVEELLINDHEVVIVDNFDNFYSKDIKLKNINGFIDSPNVKFIEADIRNKEAIDEVFKQESINLVVHLAAKAGVRPSIENIEDYYEVNITGTINILECMKKYGVVNMAFASSSSVYGNNKKAPFSESDFVDNPISPYAATKKSGELLCHVYTHLYGFNISCLRFFTVYGPRQRPDLAINKFTKLIKESKPIPFFGDGSTARDYTYVSDIVHGIMQTINRLNGFNVYNLGESNTITLNNLVQLLGKIIGKEVLINKLPKQEGDVDLTFADITKSKKELGYNPQVNIEEGLEKFVNWFNQQ